MKLLLLRYATPMITGFFLISLVSGVFLFFHVGNSLFRGMHEWLSIVLILPFCLHIWKNWRPLINYLGRLPMTVALAASIASALAFALAPASGAGGPPQMAFAHRIAGNSIEKVAPLLGDTTASLVVRLKEAGFSAAGPQLSLSDIATQSGKSEAELFSVLRTTVAGAQ